MRNKPLLNKNIIFESFKSLLYIYIFIFLEMVNNYFLSLKQISLSEEIDTDLRQSQYSYKCILYGMILRIQVEVRMIDSPHIASSFLTKVSKYYLLLTKIIFFKTNFTDFFIQFNCCGIDGATDFYEKKNSKASDRQLPLSCCNDSFNDVCLENYSHKQGCYQKIDEYIRLYSKLIISIGIGIALFEVKIRYFIIIGLY